MLIEYINASMQRARYEILEDKSIYGEIPGFEGLYANESSLEECRNELEKNSRRLDTIKHLKKFAPTETHQSSLRTSAILSSSTRG